MDFRKLAFFDAGRDSALRCPGAAARRPNLREKGSASPVQIPSLWAESGPTPRRSRLAISRGETNSFAQLVFLFSPACEFQQQSDSASERSRHPVRAFSL